MAGFAAKGITIQLYRTVCKIQSKPSRQHARFATPKAQQVDSGHSSGNTSRPPRRRSNGQATPSKQLASASSPSSRPIDPQQLQQQQLQQPEQQQQNSPPTPGSPLPAAADGHASRTADQLASQTAEKAALPKKFAKRLSEVKEYLEQHGWPSWSSQDPGASATYKWVPKAIGIAVVSHKRESPMGLEVGLLASPVKGVYIPNL